MSLFETILSAIIASGVWILIIAFLGKALISNLLAKDIEILKGQIAAQNIEHKITLQRVNEKRAEAISNIYQELIEYVSKSREFVYHAEHVEESEREKLLSSLSDASNVFKKIYQENHLYLSKKTCENIQKVFKEVQIPAHEFIYALGSYLHGGEITEEQFTNEWSKAFTNFADKIPPVLEDLENQFRELLGVENES